MAKTVKHEELNASWGEEDHLEASQNRSFAQMIFELLTEKTPTQEELQLFELILNLSIDHGPDTPSAKIVIEKSRLGHTISEAISAGITEINDVHGGAIEPCMKILYGIQKKEFQPENLIKDYKLENKKVPGFGHRIYKQSLPSSDGKESDPRAQLILEKVSQLGEEPEFIKIAKELRDEIYKQTEKALTINIDGAIAVALCTLGWDPKIGKAVFIIARTPGLCAHFLNNS